MKHANSILIKLSCENLRFLASLAETIFFSDVQFVIDIISVSLILFLFTIKL